MQVKEIMYRRLLETSPELSVDAAAREMDQRNIGSLIVSKEGKPVGIVTTRDILRKVVAKGRNAAKVTIHEIMSQPIRTIDAEEGVEKASEEMSRHNLTRLIVTENNEAVGVISVKLISKNLKYLRSRQVIDEYLDNQVASRIPGQG